jgi:hypothetical protein
MSNDWSGEARLDAEAEAEEAELEERERQREAEVAAAHEEAMSLGEECDCPDCENKREIDRESGVV